MVSKESEYAIQRRGRGVPRLERPKKSRAPERSIHDALEKKETALLF